MAQVELMDVDNDKENSLLHSNVLPRTPCNEKGYEELDVSDLNMKLRYSITPASYPMSKSLTANCKDNKTHSIKEDSLNSTIVNNSTSLTRSLNAIITKCDVSKSPKLPSQALSPDQYLDMNSIVRRSLDNDPNITVSINGNDVDENISLPSTSSSAVQTPEATPHTKEIPKDGGSSIMRGLKSVLNMFRTSQSPISHDDFYKEDFTEHLKEDEKKHETVSASMLKACDKNKENSSKRSSPLNDSMIFNDDLQRELQWKDDSTIIFKQEKIPIHKLFLQQSTSSGIEKIQPEPNESEKFNWSVECMDISYNDSVIADKTMTDIESKMISSNIEASVVESYDLSSKGNVQFEELKTLSSTLNNVKPENVVNDTYEQIPDVAIECQKESNLVDDIQVHINVTSALEVSADKDKSNNYEDQSNVSVPHNNNNNDDIKLDSFAQDKQLLNNLTHSIQKYASYTELTFDVTKPLNIVTDDDNTLSKVHDTSNNFEIIDKEKLEVIELDSQPLNSGILQICENKTGETNEDHKHIHCEKNIEKIKLEGSTKTTYFTTSIITDQLVADNIDPIDNKCKMDNVNTSDNNIFNPNETAIIPEESKPLYTDLIQDNTTEQKSIIGNISAIKFPPKNVFNLPEIGDMNFNTFASKSEIRNSPSPTLEKETVLLVENNLPSDPINNMTQKSVADTTVNIESQEDKTESPDVSSESFVSKNIDQDCTVKKIATEDEDTVEGPFLEAEEFSDVVKVSDFASERNVMEFENFHTAVNPEIKDEGEVFIDAEAFEFLLNQNKSNVVADSGKESLLLNFDPLFANRVSSDGVLAALNRIQKRHSTPKKAPSTYNQNVVINEERPVVGATNCSTLLEESNYESNITIAKPRMVFSPAINSLVSPRKSTTPPRINRRSLTFTSPALAVISRLLSLGGNSSTLDHDVSPPRINREYDDTDIALTQLRELLAEKEIHVHNLTSESKELKQRLTVMESQVKTLEKESEERLKKVNDLNERLAEKTKIIESIANEMNQEKRRNAEERARIISERDEQTTLLSSMEVSFSDLLSKYKKSKQIILSMKANEDTYKKSLKDFEDNLLKMQNNYELLKQHATSKLNYANQELEKFNRAHESEVLKLNAVIKCKEQHITSLIESLAQNTITIEKLMAICDQRINKV